MGPQGTTLWGGRVLKDKQELEEGDKWRELFQKEELAQGRGTAT